MAATVLAFDTSAAHCAAALLSGDTIACVRHEPMSRGQAERLMPMLEEVLDRSGMAFADLTAIGVGIGPGNFTGLRIAVAAARGLALGLGVPAIGITGFQAIHAACSPDPGAAQIVSIAGPRDGVYLQRFEGGQPAGPPVFGSPEDLRNAATAGVSLIVGHRCGRIGGGRIAESPVAEDQPPADLLVAAIARLALDRVARTPLPPRPAPLYVRGADAAPARAAPPVR